ncbi:TIM-barrel domain-containing protein [Christiangramia fulva]|uniref:TIM-barrel domain-containing protein n=1 Tax=Christiangramia fulva TaxID=2126553 RepID=UPI001D03CA12|nr:TIM-barrel domain-containing protein [Christiangramia fulva]
MDHPGEDWKLTKISETAIRIDQKNSSGIVVDFYGNRIFRLYQDMPFTGVHLPKANPPAKILVDNPKQPISGLQFSNNDTEIIIRTDAVKIVFNKTSGTFNVTDLESNHVVLEEVAPVQMDSTRVRIALREDPDEFFYGGGVQNGRFSHKGKTIAIENQNRWTDGGVASPKPFFWSTNGYGFMWYTFEKGEYDFGKKIPGNVLLSHNTDHLDVFFMIDKEPFEILNDYYQLTGNPVLIPKFGFYEGHLNAYNRDYWAEDKKEGITFENGKKYSESQTDSGGIKESLNGENNNYQFSARAVIDRYKKHDMPLGWILPNDGYGAGYGQTGTLEGNIQNLKEFGEYARAHGVQIGLWTQSDLHPKKGIDPLLQRDIIKEVGEAGVRVLKTDVAWVGSGYSFGLNGVADVGQIMPKYGHQARPFIITLDGWAGTQRYAAIWTGDQTGGLWEYIRFHIPTYIGAGLSGQPNITSDMDGIFGGENTLVNIRDFQWKTFTPMQLNMDGWGKNPKYPHALGEPATSINRNYLKLKSELLPYSYTIARTAVDSLPMIRPMFLEEKNNYTLGSATRYQFMYGPYFLVAPIYQNTNADSKGNDIRHGIYLPKGKWIDFFSGQEYEGGRVINSFWSPIWKLPVFVKKGAIIPLNNPNNNISEIDTQHRIYEIYPYGTTTFKQYDDDGKTTAYKKGEALYTLIESKLEDDHLTVMVHPSEGNFKGFEKEKSTEFRINLTKRPRKIKLKIDNKNIHLKEVTSLNKLKESQNAYYYNDDTDFNRFATKGSEFEKVKIRRNPQLIVKVQKADITTQALTVFIKGYEFNSPNQQKRSSGKLTPINQIKAKTSPYNIKLSWESVPNADYYEIKFNGLIYSTIKKEEYLIEYLQPEKTYSFQIRAVNKNEYSPWQEFSATTNANPLEFAIRGITAKTNVKNQPGDGIANLFDFDEGTLWHTQWGKSAVPFELVIDLNSFTKLDKLEYVPRSSGGNGIILKGAVSYSSDAQHWIPGGNIQWNNNSQNKHLKFTKQPVARYIKISVTEGVGGFGSGRELYVFRVPGASSYLPGDINNDQLIDSNDLTSYQNYTGLKLGDSDFEGYVSNGDVNKNGIIDAYDISNVAIKLEGGIAKTEKSDSIAGNIVLQTEKNRFDKGEIIQIKVIGKKMEGVNAFSFALPYDTSKFEYLGVEPLGTKEMKNFTNNRLHTNGQTILYPTFVNLGNKETLNGDLELMIIKLKAKRPVTYNLHLSQGIMVDKNLHSNSF